MAEKGIRPTTYAGTQVQDVFDTDAGWATSATADTTDAALSTAQKVSGWDTSLPPSGEVDNQVKNAQFDWLEYYNDIIVRSFNDPETAGADLTNGGVPDGSLALIDVYDSTKAPLELLYSVDNRAAPTANDGVAVAADARFVYMSDGTYVKILNAGTGASTENFNHSVAVTALYSDGAHLYVGDTLGNIKKYLVTDQGTVSGSAVWTYARPGAGQVNCLYSDGNNIGFGGVRSTSNKTHGTISQAPAVVFEADMGTGEVVHDVVGNGTNWWFAHTEAGGNDVTKYDYDGSNAIGLSNGSVDSFSLSIDDQHLYVGSSDATVRAYGVGVTNTTTGTAVWSNDLGTGDINSIAAIRTTRWVAVSRPRSGTVTLSILDKYTGLEMWSYDHGSTSAQPAQIATDGFRIYSTGAEDGS